MLLLPAAPVAGEGYGMMLAAPFLFFFLGNGTHGTNTHPNTSTD